MTDASHPPAVPGSRPPADASRPPADGPGRPETARGESALSVPSEVPPADSGPVPFPAHAPVGAGRAGQPSRGIAGWALGASILALTASLFVGWGFPVGVVAVVAAGMALRRPGESRSVAGWALALGILSLIYSAIWIAWAASQATLFG